ncbi:hypothetical protein DICPUDRAFT_151752 [Dictyostelium purpureum]|uniref:Uncharacterized protein n=1 Tax=Dictyostelium purpureum TaxID=5786 RepID=F0ZJP2_DICPU|nr:uncharacterized protein DICPUDRAFT_151752 [Dictyostelium purpureum]EGC35849.1 hypothetical protein DICPUDRAFT_151752 [Dictyostelium purpureum]|eukprot:XP_003287638.1 hypothetical protein DICPUDRAFT_151752 [Dictyostelium purpureum]
MAFTPNSMDQSRKYHVFDDSYYEKEIKSLDIFNSYAENNINLFLIILIILI